MILSLQYALPENSGDTFQFCDYDEIKDLAKYMEEKGIEDDFPYLYVFTQVFRSWEQKTLAEEAGRLAASKPPDEIKGLLTRLIDIAKGIPENVPGFWLIN